MDFTILYESMLQGNLILLDGALCRYKFKKNGQITIYSLLSYKKGQGRFIINQLMLKNPKSIFAKCPEEYESNGFYQHLGFTKELQEVRKGKIINHWRLKINK